MSENGYILMRVDPFIWHNDQLNYPEKLLLNVVFGFTIDNKCCHLADTWFATKFGWTPQFVTEMVKMLKMRGYLLVTEDVWGFGFVRGLSVPMGDRECPCIQSEQIIHIQV